MRFFRSLLLIVFVVGFPTAAFAQSTPEKVQPEVDFDSPDSLYREDQFYLRITYNGLSHTPSGFSQARFSPGFGFGFLRDMPFNSERTWSVALGIGYGFEQYSHNVTIQGTGDEAVYAIQNNFSTNKQKLHTLEFPLEIRWRDSNAENHEFWRIHLGFKASYVFYQEYIYSGTTDFIHVQMPNANKWILGSYLSAGYNTWNIYGGYDWTPLFKNAQIQGTSLNMSGLHFGLMFYIL